MRISFEAQPLLDKQKTGIPYCEKGIVTSMISAHPENHYQFDCFVFREYKEKMKRLDYLRGINVSFKVCRFIPHKLYRLITLMLPFPYSLLFGRKSDVTHFFNYVVPPFVHGKKVVTVHDMTFMAYPETMAVKTKFALKMLAQRSMKRADKIIAVSDFTKQEIIKYYGISPKKIEIVYNAVDLNVYRNDFTDAEIAAVKESFSIDGEYFLYLGTLEPRKNLERLIAAYAKLREKHSDAPKLVIAGKKGWLFETIFSSVSKYGLMESVVFTDYVSEKDAPKLMHGAFAFCFPSIYEGYGMPVLEAMACGTAVLTSAVSSMPEVTGDCAVLVNPFSVESITEGMEKMMIDERLRNELAHNGRIRAEGFSWLHQSEKLVRIYRELVGN